MVLLQGRVSGSGATHRGSAPSMASTHPLRQVLEELRDQSRRNGVQGPRISRGLIFGESEA